MADASGWGAPVVRTRREVRTMSKLSQAAAVLGRKGGKSLSDRKVAASRRNAVLGGIQPDTIATVLTYDPLQYSDEGFEVRIREDGSLRLKSRSRYPGHRTDEVWVVPCPPEILARAQAPGVDESDPQLIALVCEWVAETDWSQGARQVSLGYVVK
jgi:hypothetical protein